LVVGGFAIIEAGFPRLTVDIDLLVDVSPENERRVFEALRILPDRAVDQLEPGDLERYLVVRVGDEVVVDLMQSSCGIGYSEAIQDAIYREVEGVRIPFASPRMLWRMKQTVREKDIPDRMFLRKLLESQNVHFEPEETPPSGKPRSLRAWLKRFLGRSHVQ
jgi:hypothetical protein